MSESSVEKKYILYDGRAVGGNPDRASILDMADDIEEIAEVNKDRRGESGVWYEYDIQGDDLVNPVERMDLFNYSLKPRKKRKRR